MTFSRVNLSYSSLTAVRSSWNLDGKRVGGGKCITQMSQDKILTPTISGLWRHTKWFNMLTVVSISPDVPFLYSSAFQMSKLTSRLLEQLLSTRRISSLFLLRFSSVVSSLIADPLLSFHIKGWTDHKGYIHQYAMEIGQILKQEAGWLYPSHTMNKLLLGSGWMMWISCWNKRQR